MRQAIWGETIIAESEITQKVDGYEYFPPETVRWELLAESSATSVCHWKGQANYFDVVVAEDRLTQAAWVYRHPSPAADHLRGHIAFWRGVHVIESK
jgi:uncharacterized protein (DUF427 family)